MKQTKLFLSLLMLVVFGIGNVWGETYQHIFSTKPNIGKDVLLSGVKWNIEADNLGLYNGQNYAGVQFGTSTKNGLITLTSAADWSFNKATKITEIRLWLNLGGTSVTPSVTVGGKTAISDEIAVIKNSKAGKDWTKTTKVTFTPAADGNSGIVVISAASVKAGYICAVEIDCEVATIAPAISLTPAEMTFSVGDASNEILATVENYNGDLTWKCSKEGIVRLTPSADTKTATIEPIAVGTCDVTAAATVDGKTYSGSCRITVVPAISRYTITYETNGGTAVEKSEQQTNLPATLPTTTKVGYNFYGWYVDADCKTLAEAGAPLTDNVTLYALWVDPYHVEYAWSLIDEKMAEKDVNVYVKGYVSAIDDVSGIEKYGYITYTISDDSKTLTVFRGYNLNDAKFTSTDQLHLGDVVVVYGKLINYNGKYEIDASNYIYSRTEAVAHRIELLQDAGGTITSDKASAKMGETVTLTATPASHYKFTDWMVSIKGSSKNVTVTDNTFIMPNADVEVMGGFMEQPKYTISLAVAKNGETARGTAYFENTTDDVLEWYADEEPKIVAKSVDEDAYIFDKWEVTSGTATIVDPTSATTTLQLSTVAEITAYFISKPVAATITLSENGVENPSKLNGTVGELITLPMAAGGNCNKAVEFVGWSEVEIANSASEPTANFYAPGAAYTIQQESTTLYAVYAKTKTEGAFRKVTTVPADWSGEYLIVNEENSVVFNGSIDGNFDVVNNNKAVAITDNTIAIKDGEDYTFMIAKSGTGYTLQSKSGYYIGGKSSAGIDSNKNNSFVHTFEVISSGVTIQTQYDGNARYLRYNATSGQNRFRYYNSSETVKDVTLYVKKGRTYSDYSTTCAEAVEVAMPMFSVEGGEYTEAQSVEISCATDGATIYYTLDGTEPTNASTKYAGAIDVTKSMTIKAIAYVGTDNYSDVATAEYVVLQAPTIYWYVVEDGEEITLTEKTIYTDGGLNLGIESNSKGTMSVSSSNEDVATIALLQMPELTLTGKAGTTTITVNVAKDETYVSGSASFELHVVEHKTIVNMSFAAASCVATLGEEFTAPALTVSPSVAPVVYSSSDENVAKADATTGEITLVGMGTTTITAIYDGDETHDPATAQYILNVTDPNADILTIDMMNTSNSYKDFTCTGSATGTSYAGCNMKSSGGYIQIRSSSSNSTYTGIISMVSKGFIKSVSITFAEANTNGIDIYANLTPYEKVSDLYNGATRGVKLTSLKGQTDETVTFAPVENYPYIGIRSNSGAAYIKQIAIAWTPTEVVRKGLTEGKFGTICLEKNVTTSLGASFYEIAYREDQNGEPYKVNFDEVTELEAGVPYIFLAEDEQITVVYGEETANAAGSRNGLVGTFEVIQDGAAGTAGNTLEGNYLVNNNQIRKCLGNCSLPANRAYIRMDDVTTNAVAPQPGRRRVTLQNAATGTATGWEGITEDSTVAPQQEGIYDVLGRKLESAESGFYIINGKKQVIVK